MEFNKNLFSGGMGRMPWLMNEDRRALRKANGGYYNPYKPQIPKTGGGFTMPGQFPSTGGGFKMPEQQFGQIGIPAGESFGSSGGMPQTGGGFQMPQQTAPVSGQGPDATGNIFMSNPNPSQADLGMQRPTFGMERGGFGQAPTMPPTGGGMRPMPFNGGGGVDLNAVRRRGGDMNAARRTKRPLMAAIMGDR